MDGLDRDLEYVFGELERPALEPDPARTGFGGHGAVLLQLCERFKGVLARLETGGAAVDTQRGVAGDVAIMVAAAMFAAGSPEGARALLARVQRLLPEGAQRDGLAAGERDPRGLTLLVHARWLDRHGRTAAAIASKQLFLAHTREPALLAAFAPAELPPPQRGLGTRVIRWFLGKPP